MSAGTIASSQNLAIAVTVFYSSSIPGMASLRDLIERGGTLVAPGATDALSAKLIEAHGFECVYIGSYATAASRFAIPDTGLLSLDALVEQARTIAAAVKLPVIADAEGGFPGAEGGFH